MRSLELWVIGLALLLPHLATAQDRVNASPAAPNAPLAVSGTSLDAQIAQDSPRNTPLVRMIRKSVPAVVTIYSISQPDSRGARKTQTGSASIIDPDGYALTAAHVLAGGTEWVAFMHDGTSRRVHPVAWIDTYDVALVRILHSAPLPSVAIGRSHDLMLGEPIIAIGNPRGVGLTVSEGVVSGLNRYALQSQVFTRGMLQTSAPVFPGNSGGPLLNAEGAQVGMVLRGHNDAESLGLSMAADRIRELFPKVLAIEANQGLRIGFSVDPLVDPPTISAIEADGPAFEAALEEGDVIIQINDEPIQFAYQLPLKVIGRKPGDVLTIQVRRDNEVKNVTLTLAAASVPRGVAEDVKLGLKPGLHYQTYLLDPLTFDNTLKMAFSGTAVGSGVVDWFDIEKVKPRDEYFAIRFDGFLKVTNANRYQFLLASDDGSRLQLANNDLIVNDGDHPALEEASLVRLDEGVYPVRLDYFQGRGNRSLSIRWQSDEMPIASIPRSALLHAPATKAN